MTPEGQDKFNHALWGQVSYAIEKRFADFRGVEIEVAESGIDHCIDRLQSMKDELRTPVVPEVEVFEGCAASRRIAEEMAV